MEAAKERKDTVDIDSEESGHSSEDDDDLGDETRMAGRTRTKKGKEVSLGLKLELFLLKLICVFSGLDSGNRDKGKSLACFWEKLFHS